MRVEPQKEVTRRHDLLCVLVCQFSRISANGILQFCWIIFEHTSNAMFCHFPLNLAVWPQPSRFRKAEIQICAFLRGFAPCLRACFGPECITLLLKKMSMGLDGEELK